MRVLVTGAAGYIGGQTLLYLRDKGHEVYGLDNRAPSDILEQAATGFIQDDLVSGTALDWIRDQQPDTVIHCAGTSLVGPSMAHPATYYLNNFVKTKQLVDNILCVSPRTRLVFSSSASVYGTPVITPCHEVDPVLPISPYGESKAMIEWMLASYARAYGLDYVAFRYFNACGADPETRHGQADHATHVIARVLESTRDDRAFVVYGDRYPTSDGTCVRDYVHVQDIARAHALAMDTAIPRGSYNLGTGQGHSVRQIIETAQRVTGRQCLVDTGPARPGDPPELTASADQFLQASGWRAEFGLEQMIQHAWAWYTR